MNDKGGRSMSVCVGGVMLKYLENMVFGHCFANFAAHF